MAASPRRIPGTGRVEAFSDGVVAIIITLLIFEVRLPELPPNATNQEMLTAFGSIAPKLASFAVSFVTVAIFWVNHHSFFGGITHTDWKLLWAHNVLLFFLASSRSRRPSSATMSGSPSRWPDTPLNLGLAGASFTAMGWYVLFKARLITPESRMRRAGSRSSGA